MQKMKKFENLKKNTSLSCTAHLLIHLKELYDYVHIAKFSEPYESIWDHMLHYTLKISHCTGETQTQYPAQSPKSVSVIGVRSMVNNCGCPHQTPCAVVFLLEVA